MGKAADDQSVVMKLFLPVGAQPQARRFTSPASTFHFIPFLAARKSMLDVKFRTEIGDAIVRRIFPHAFPSDLYRLISFTFLRRNDVGSVSLAFGSSQETQARFRSRKRNSKTGAVWSVPFSYSNLIKCNRYRTDERIRCGGFCWYVGMWCDAERDSSICVYI